MKKNGIMKSMNKLKYSTNTLYSNTVYGNTVEKMNSILQDTWKSYKPKCVTKSETKISMHL